MAKSSSKNEVFDNSLCSKDCKKNTDSLNKTLKLEKDGVDGKLAGLLKASKDLDNVIKSQRPLPTIESTSGDDQNRNSSASENGESTDSIFSKPAVKFVKAAERACFNCGHFDHLSYDCGLGVKRGTTRPQNNTHESMPPRPAIHRPYRPPMRPMRPNMIAGQPKRTSFYKPAHSYNKRPFQETTQDLMIILIQRVQRLERELKVRTPKVDRGRSSKEGVPCTSFFFLRTKIDLVQGQKLGEQTEFQALQVSFSIFHTFFP
nr:hypothetical protein [Tanacetum cinerariifolium]